MYFWFLRNQSKLFTLDIVCMILLLFLHLFTTTFQLSAPELANIVQIIAAVLVSFIFLSVVWKGTVPMIICILGIVLMHYSIALPYYPAIVSQEMTFGDTKFSFVQDSPQIRAVAVNMYFFLGAGMAAFSMIIVYRPSILFTRNRPESPDSEWSKYPVWQDNTLLAYGRTVQSVPVKNLMTEQDRYLLWRYEYVLASINGTPHLVRPEGLVPKDSTDILRDRASGLIIGKARYTGFFM